MSLPRALAPAQCHLSTTGYGGHPVWIAVANVSVGSCTTPMHPAVQKHEAFQLLVSETLITMLSRSPLSRLVPSGPPIEARCQHLLRTYLLLLWQS